MSALPYPFRAWLSFERHREDAVGVAARLLRQDDCAPTGRLATHERIREHLRYLHLVSAETLTAFDAAWREYLAATDQLPEAETAR